MAHERRSRPSPRVRKGMPSARLDHDEFVRHFRERFADPAFEGVDAALREVAEVAWRSYDEYHKSPRTRRAGRGFADPDFELPVEWLATRRAIQAAEARWRDPASPARILVINGSARSDQSCPGEMSKTHRLAQLAIGKLERARAVEVDYLDLSLLISQYGRVIFPCKACVSTAQPLCHWPCSCYPNHALGQTQDWMNEIYPRWAAAHGVFVTAPVNYYQAPSVLKLMIDRLVCADGGNPDPTSTGGKDPAAAKRLELEGWPFPKHLAGRAFAVVVHGDASGVENLRRMLCDWLADLELVPAGPTATIDRYLGYYAPYATSHDELDRDQGLQAEVETAAASLLQTVREMRSGKYRRPDHGIEPPRRK